MILINAGDFQMGTDNPKFFGMDGNAHVHEVHLDGFYISKYLVSANDYNSYLSLIGKNKQLKKNRKSLKEGNIPAVAAWKDASGYCKWLGKKTGLPFSLPSEAQWEYVARSGDKNYDYPTQNGKMEAGKNYPTQSDYSYKMDHVGLWGSDIGVNPLPVNDIPINALGVHQMGGNASEWMKDWYDRDYYWHSKRNNPEGPQHFVGSKKYKQQIKQDFAPAKVTRGASADFLSLRCDEKDIACQQKIFIKDGHNYWRANDSIYDQDLISFRCVINGDQDLAPIIKKFGA